ncbi:MAG: hypothetical protein ACK520_09930 [Inhella sp.]|uniref:hypothetical protein n=1 Tax=Inhella sp. TaxID=1921806 RepID=UPI0022C4C2F1|nr:hypothetical protein [Inhella sp.]MCZ8234591.1 hypothetical protein [Inhella sp.]
MTRRLPALSCPVQTRRWQALCFDGEAWALLPTNPGADALPLLGLDVVADFGSALWLRARWRGDASRWGWRWPAEQHLWLRRGRDAVDWPLLRAALAQGRRWLGDGAPTDASTRG